MRLADKVSIITGAGRGIGQATAFKFAQEGAKSSCAISIAPSVDETVESVAAEAAKWMDSSSMSPIEPRSRHGRRRGRQVRAHRLLVNNAGIVQDAQLMNMTTSSSTSVIDVNLKGTWNCTKAVADVMLEQKSGVILNASSVVGIYGNFGQTNYAASKFGVIGMVKTWARELGRKGIRANAVCPGFVETPILSSIPEKVLKRSRACPAGPPRAPGRDRQHVCFSRFRRSELHQRRGDRGQRRSDGVSAVTRTRYRIEPQSLPRSPGARRRAR